MIDIRKLVKKIVSEDNVFAYNIFTDYSDFRKFMFHRVV